MVQDAKEEKPPEVPEEIAKLHKYKGDADQNPRDIFWGLVKKYVEKEGFEEEAKKCAKDMEALVNISASVLLEEERTYRVKMTKVRLAECIMEMVVLGGWEDAFGRLLENLYDRKRGPNLNMMLAFGNVARKNGKVLEWIKKMLAEERPHEPLLAYIAQLGDKELAASIKEQLIFIAKSEINEPQLYALEALAPLIKKDAAVKKVFVDLMDDWDVKAKKVALENLSGIEDEEIGKRAVTAYVYEFDPYSKRLLKGIIKTNKEWAKEEVKKYMGKYNEKVNREIVELAEAIYGKKAAKEMLAEHGEAKAGLGGVNRWA